MIADYLEQCRGLVDTVAAQENAIAEAAGLFAETILAGRMVHLFGSGHSRILVEEMWPRYGSFPGFNPIVELSLSFHNLVVGANGQRQAMFLENVHGLAARILRNYDLSPEDTALVASSSGCNLVPIEMAEEFKRRGVRVVAIVSRAHSEASRSSRRDGRKLQDFADVVLDTGAPVGDAMVQVPGLETPVAPGSTVGGCMLVNAIKAEVAALLTEAGQPPRVLTAPAIAGRDHAAELFESAYDEHARRLAKLYANIGEERPGRGPRPERPSRAPRSERGGRREMERDEPEPRPVSERRSRRDEFAPPPPEEYSDSEPAPPSRRDEAARAERPGRPADDGPAYDREDEPMDDSEGMDAEAEARPAEVPKPANWDRMDDIERRLWLRENGQAPAAPERAERGEDRGDDRGRRRAGRGGGGGRGGGRGRRGGRGRGR